jgi:hypothetical protein
VGDEQAQTRESARARATFVRQSKQELTDTGSFSFLPRRVETIKSRHEQQHADSQLALSFPDELYKSLFSTDTILLVK